MLVHIHLWHPDHDPHLPQLLRRHTDRTARGSQSRPAQVSFAFIARSCLPLSASGVRRSSLIWQFHSVWNDFLFAVTTDPNQANWPVTVCTEQPVGQQ